MCGAGLLWRVARSTHPGHRRTPRRAGIVAILVLLGLTIAAASALALSWADSDGASAGATSLSARRAAEYAALTAAARPAEVAVTVSRGGRVARWRSGSSVSPSR